MRPRPSLTIPIRTLGRLAAALGLVLASAATAQAGTGSTASRPQGNTAQPSRSGTHGRTARPHASRPRPSSASLGYANGGRLQHAARLVPDQSLRHLPGRPLDYGTDELVALLRRASRTVHRTHHVRLAVGDLSAEHGGPVGQHVSHQSGRDADLCFYVMDARGRNVSVTDYVTFGADGRAVGGGGLRFDVEKNWALVNALVMDPVSRVEHIFVSDGLRALLLDFARRIGAPAENLRRAAEALHQPRNGSPHRNHFHVRIACPAGDAACVDGIRPRTRRHPHRNRASGVRTARADVPAVPRAHPEPVETAAERPSEPATPESSGTTVASR